MPIKYDIYPNPTPIEDESKPKYHARIIAGGMAGIDTLTDEIRKASSLSPGDIISVLTELRSSMVTNLREGKRIHLPGIGFFELGVSSPSIDNDGPFFPSKRLKVKTIKFLPEKDLKLDVCAGITFERVKYLKHSIKRSENDDLAMLRQLFADRSVLSSRDMAQALDYTMSKTYRLLKAWRSAGYVEECGYRNLNLYKATSKLYGE